MPLPDVLVKKVDEYVDSLAPQIQSNIASELERFQQTTIDGLEAQVIDAFQSLFHHDDNPSGRGLYNPTESPPDAYGGQSLPFATELAQLTRSFGDITNEASDNLRDIFQLTQAAHEPGPQARGADNHGFSSAKSFLSAAINAVQDHVDKSQGGQNFQLDGLLAVISDTVKDAARNPEEKARAISPEIKEQVGARLREQHAAVADQFTRIALDRLKQWLHHNTSTRDIGDGAKAELHDQVKDLVKGLGGMFGNKKESSQDALRAVDDQASEDQGSGGGGGGGFSKVVSDKLSIGIAKVHRDVRLEFRNVLGGIEKQLFEMLPDQFQRPLEKILGGNPFDSQLDSDAAPSGDRGWGDDVKAKLVDKIRGLVRKVQESLRTAILAVVNGGHRKFERESWLFVQSMVEQKVQKYLPKVKITVPDDIGNEGVSVGAPTQNLGGGHAPNQSVEPQGYHPPGYNNPQPYDSSNSYHPQSQSSPLGYSDSQNNHPPSYVSPQGYPISQNHNLQEYPPQGYGNSATGGPQYHTGPSVYHDQQGYGNQPGYSNPQGYDSSQNYHG